jgi:hypothetical protein
MDPTHSRSRHYLGVSGQRHAPAALYPGKGPPVLVGQEAGWAPELVWTRLGYKKNPVCPAGNRPSIVQSLSQTLLCLSYSGSFKTVNLPVLYGCLTWSVVRKETYTE